MSYGRTVEYIDGNGKLRKRNDYSLNKAGQPRKIESPQWLVDTLEEYIAEEVEEKENLPDIKAFCMFAGFSTQTLYNIERNPEYFEALSYVYDRLQYQVMNTGHKSNNSRFYEFILKNRFRNDFKDSKEIVNVENKGADSIEELEEKRKKVLEDVKNKAIEVVDLSTDKQ